MIKLIIKISLIAILSFPNSCLSQESSDYLRPCAGGLMGFQFLDEYNSYLKRYFFIEKNIEDPANFTRIFVTPSFEKEEYLSLYQDGEVYHLLYVIPKESIWASLQNSKQKVKDPSFPNITEIQVIQKLKKVSKELYDAITKAMWKMAMNSKYPPKNRFNVLDGTNYIFSAGLGVCVMSTGQGGKNIDTLIQVTHMLIDYAKLEGYSVESENKIINISRTLKE